MILKTLPIQFNPFQLNGEVPSKEEVSILLENMNLQNVLRVGVHTRKKRQRSLSKEYLIKLQKTYNDKENETIYREGSDSTIFQILPLLDYEKVKYVLIQTMITKEVYRINLSQTLIDMTKAVSSYENINAFYLERNKLLHSLMQKTVIVATDQQLSNFNEQFYALIEDSDKTGNPLKNLNFSKRNQQHKYLFHALNTLNRILDTFVKLHIEVDLEKIDVKQLTDYPLNICDKLTLKTSHCSLSDTVLIWMASLNNDSKLSSITVVMPSDKLLNISQKLLPSALNNLGELEINFVVSNSTLSFRNQQSLIANSKDP